MAGRMEGMELEQANGLQLEQNAQFSKVSTTLKSNQSFETHFPEELTFLFS
jgi:hypothetical protein